MRGDVSAFILKYADNNVGRVGMTATLVEDEELQRLRAMAEGSRAFERSALWERAPRQALQPSQVGRAGG